MRDRDLYAQILGITAPCHVSDVRLDGPAGKVAVVVEHRGQACCPQCGKACPGYDTRQRRWRHLDTCQLQSVLVADVPRVECSEHGVVQAATPWSDPGSRFTALFERVVIDWLREASFSAVERGLERRGACAPRRIGLDETSFQKRHEYVTVVTDLDGRRLLSVLNGRTRESVNAHLSALPEAVRASAEVVAMDMWWQYMDAAAK
jgi:transposase